jgi:hypothetical protein
MGRSAARAQARRASRRVLGTRTYHRMAVAIEDAGFEIRDQLAWVYGSGFPKSHNQPGGWGTALKPSWEPIALAASRSIGTVAANMAKWGTGAINIDGCRMASLYSSCRPSKSRPRAPRIFAGRDGRQAGRFEARRSALVGAVPVPRRENAELYGRRGAAANFTIALGAAPMATCSIGSSMPRGGHSSMR